LIFELPGLKLAPAELHRFALEMKPHKEAGMLSEKSEIPLQALWNFRVEGTELPPLEGRAALLLEGTTETNAEVSSFGAPVLLRGRAEEAGLRLQVVAEPLPHILPYKERVLELELPATGWENGSVVYREWDFPNANPAEQPVEASRLREWTAVSGEVDHLEDEGTLTLFLNLLFQPLNEEAKGEFRLRAEIELED
jgi:hypothetical protein